MLSFNGKKIMGNLIFGAGMKGETDSAEVFNDYKNNKAVADFTRASGSHSQAGSMAFTVLAIDYNKKTFTLDDTTGLEKTIENKKTTYTYSIQLSTKVPNQDKVSVVYAFKFGKITSINGNVVTVDAMPEELNGVTLVEVDPINKDYGIDFEQNSFQVPELPNIGNRRIGSTAIVDGFRCWALRRYSHAWGDSCKAVAPGSTAGGKDSEARGVGSVAIGVGVVACAESQAVYGKYNVLKKEPIFILGNGTSGTKRSNALEIYPDGTVVILDESSIDYITSQDEFNTYITDAITNTVGNMKNNGDLGDYIVEQGTSGIWTYRKWKSGLAECWGAQTITTSINVASGNIFTSATLSATDFPFTFKEAPMVNASMGSGSYMSWIMTSGVNGSEATTTNTGRFKLGRSTKAENGTYIINYDVKGRWKG